MRSQDGKEVLTNQQGPVLKDEYTAPAPDYALIRIARKAGPIEWGILDPVANRFRRLEQECTERPGLQLTQEAVASGQAGFRQHAAGEHPGPSLSEQQYLPQAAGMPQIDLQQGAFIRPCPAPALVLNIDPEVSPAGSHQAAGQGVVVEQPGLQGNRHLATRQPDTGAPGGPWTGVENGWAQAHFPAVKNGRENAGKAGCVQARLVAEYGPPP